MDDEFGRAAGAIYAGDNDCFASLLSDDPGLATRTSTVGRETVDIPGQWVRLRSTSSGDREVLVGIRSTEEVRRRWRGKDLEAEFDADLGADEVHRLTIDPAADNVAAIACYTKVGDVGDG